MDLGIQMRVEILSDSSTAKYLMDRLGAGPRTKHIDTGNFSMQEQEQDGDLSIKIVHSPKNSADVGTKAVCASVVQHHCAFAGLVLY